MFCPTCGIEDRNGSQFCRGCGAELRAVRTVLKQPDANASAKTAKDDIARALAAKIKELEDADDLKHVAEDVLPQIEKFLESPEERRLRRLRAGVIVSLIGLGPVLFLLIFGSVFHDQDMAGILALLGLATFFIGAALIINGLFFSLPKKINTRDMIGGSGFDQAGIAASSTSRIDQQALPEPASIASVIEHTTKHLPVEVIKQSQPRNTRE